jgi:hypothetical protein
MGLDMYLYKKNYIWQGEWIKPEVRQEVIVKKDGEVDTSIKPERVKYVIEEVGYWRKANQIHQWFVENVQQGEDDCKSYWVSRENLIELLDICKQIKEDNSKAESLLPTQSGFFFGGTEYNEWYFNDINNTIEILEEILSDESADDFEYQSSW